MRRKENKKEVQVSREYNNQPNGKQEKKNHNSGNKGVKHAQEDQQPNPQSSKSVSTASNDDHNFEKGFPSNVHTNITLNNTPYKKDDRPSIQPQNNQKELDGEKINEEKILKKNGNQEIQQILKSTLEAKDKIELEEEDDDDVEFEIVSYEDSSDDEKADSIEEEGQESKMKGLEGKYQQQQQQETVNATPHLGLRVNTQSENENDGKNDSAEEDIFSEYTKVGEGYAQFNLPKLIKEKNLMEDLRKEAEIQNLHLQSQQQQGISSKSAQSANTFDKTRNKSAQSKQTAALQQQQEIQAKSREQRIQYCHQQLSQKKTITTRSSGNNNKAGVFISGKMSYNNTNNSIGSDYQTKYISSRKRRSVTDPELESLGLHNLNKRRDNKPNIRYNEESETHLQEYDENSDGIEENSKTRRNKQQQTKAKNPPRNNNRSNDSAHSKPTNNTTTAQNKKKIEQNLNAADDDILDVPVTLGKDQQMELLKYHKRSKNYHGTAKQFGISHEEARVIVKKLKKEYRSIQNY